MGTLSALLTIRAIQGHVRSTLEYGPHDGSKITLVEQRVRKIADNICALDSVFLSPFGIVAGGGTGNRGY